MARPYSRLSSSVRREGSAFVARGWLLTIGLALAPFGALSSLASCQSTETAPGAAPSTLPRPDLPTPRSDAGTGNATTGDASSSRDGGASTLRIMAANTSSGNTPTYEPGEGIRMFQGLHPDIALIQELNYHSNSNDDLRSFVDEAFGSEFGFYVEPNAEIPNAIVSRYPILEKGEWQDPMVGNRSFVYAKIAIPGDHPLWAVSVHLLTRSSSSRNEEARALVDHLKSVITDGDYVTVGGDFNTDGRNESCLSTFRELLDTQAPHPADHRGNDDTNANRNKPYDWVVVDSKLKAFQIPTVIGQNTFSDGLVFDSRVYNPLEDVAPVRRSDSDAVNMQHMPVVKDFRLQ